MQSHPLSQRTVLVVVGAFLSASAFSASAATDKKDVTVAPGDQKTVGFATKDPGDTYELNVYPAAQKFITGGGDNILGENRDGALWMLTLNQENHKQFKVTSANIHSGHEALFHFKFKEKGNGGGGGGSPLADAYVKAINCFVKIHTPGTIAAPGTLIAPPTAVGMSYMSILQRNTDDEITTGIEDCNQTSKQSGLATDNDMVKAELSWNSITLKPGMVEGKTLRLTLPPNAKAYLASGVALTEMTVTIGSGSSGQLAPLGGSARKQNIFIEGNAAWGGGEIILNVDGLDVSGAQGKAKLVPVSIVPDTNVAGVLGNVVPSNKAPTGEKHFVSPRKTTEIPNDYVTLKAEGVPVDLFQQLLQWDFQTGVEAVPDEPLKCRVKRDVAGKRVTKIKCRGTEVEKMNVWTVWADLNGTVQPVVVQPINSVVNRRLGDEVLVHYDCATTIAPADIVKGSDWPDLRGVNSAPTPGNNVSGQPLAAGANKKWDMSRRIARTMHVTSTPPPPPDPKDVDIAFPAVLTVGNDDADTRDETNDPYLNTSGVITSWDNLSRKFELPGGHNGAIYENLTVFQEFARLDIGGKWYVISDPDEWKVSFFFNKIEISEADWDLDANNDGDKSDLLTEADLAVDLNGDGDKDDNVTRWRNNESISTN